MVALQIRDVPDDVRDDLADAARARGVSLQAYLLDLVEQDARRVRKAAWLARMRANDDLNPVPGRLSIADLIRQDRERDTPRR